MKAVLYLLNIRIVGNGSRGGFQPPGNRHAGGGVCQQVPGHNAKVENHVQQRQVSGHSAPGVAFGGNLFDILLDLRGSYLPDRHIPEAVNRHTVGGLIRNVGVVGDQFAVVGIPFVRNGCERAAGFLFLLVCRHLFGHFGLCLAVEIFSCGFPVFGGCKRFLPTTVLAFQHKKYPPFLNFACKIPGQVI